MCRSLKSFQYVKRPLRQQITTIRNSEYQRHQTEERLLQCNVFGEQRTKSFIIASGSPVTFISKCFLNEITRVEAFKTTYKVRTTKGLNPLGIRKQCSEQMKKHSTTSNLKNTNISVNGTELNAVVKN